MNLSKNVEKVYNEIVLFDGKMAVNKSIHTHVNYVIEKESGYVGVVLHEDACTVREVDKNNLVLDLTMMYLENANKTIIERAVDYNDNCCIEGSRIKNIYSIFKSSFEEPVEMKRIFTNEENNKYEVKMGMVNYRLLKMYSVDEVYKFILDGKVKDYVSSLFEVDDIVYTIVQDSNDNCKAHPVYIDLDCNVCLFTRLTLKDFTGNFKEYNSKVADNLKIKEVYFAKKDGDKVIDYKLKEIREETTEDIARRILQEKGIENPTDDMIKVAIVLICNV